MQILLFGKSSSITTTVQSMLQSINNWSAHLHSDLNKLNSIHEEGSEYDLLIANLEDYAQASTKVISQIRDHFPGIPLLVIHSYLNKTLIKPMINAGATGYIRNNLSEDLLVEAVQKVATGTEYIIAKST
jgi:DNA-binding NarL/FixJ family response regulator